jgi:uncharacterized protein
MIATFPKFSKLSLKHKSFIEKYVSAFPPYSDFNFLSLWTYNIYDDVYVSLLNGNVVIRFRNYIDHKQFYSFLGSRKPLHTIKVLLEKSQENDIEEKLQLVPELSLPRRTSLSKHYAINEARGHNDYIYKISELAELPGKQFSRKRWRANRFEKDYPHCKIVELDLSNIGTHKKILNLYYKWQEPSSQTENDVMHEVIALRRMLRHAGKLKINGLGYFISGKLVALSTFEFLNKGYVMGHFAKADISYPRIYDYMYYSTAKFLNRKGHRYLNLMQDLDKPGLRKAKTSWKQVKFLKKYTVSRL